MVKRMGSQIWVAAMTLSVIGLTVACSSASPPETGASSVTESMADRSDYNEVPLPPETQRLGEDPEQIVLEAFGAPQPVEGNFSQEVMVADQSPTLTVVTLTQTGLLDDSIEGMRYRLELVAKGNQWELVWAGRQVRCYPDRGSQTWTTDLCS